MIEAMQQTDKYKLNKPGVDDPIAIAPLNENMDKVEAALAAETAVRQGETAALAARAGALEGRAAALETHRIAIGSYKGGSKSDIFLNLGFTPMFALIDDHSVLQGKDLYISTYVNARIVENGILIPASAVTLNNTNRTHDYFAIV